MKKFVTEIVDAFDVDSGAVRFATLRYSTSPEKLNVVHQLNTYNTAAKIKKAIMDMPHSGGATHTAQ